jgi:hypothetical protein
LTDESLLMPSFGVAVAELAGDIVEFAGGVD